MNIDYITTVYIGDTNSGLSRIWRPQCFHPKVTHPVNIQVIPTYNHGSKRMWFWMISSTKKFFYKCYEQNVMPEKPAIPLDLWLHAYHISLYDSTSFHIILHRSTALYIIIISFYIYGKATYASMVYLVPYIILYRIPFFLPNIWPHPALAACLCFTPKLWVLAMFTSVVVILGSAAFFKQWVR